MDIERDPEQIETRYLHEFINLTNARVLEVGCGDGRLTWRYAESAKQVVGVEPDMTRLAAALASRPPDLQSVLLFTQTLGEALPLPRQTFDRALLAWSL